MALAATSSLTVFAKPTTSAYTLIADYSGPSFFDGFTTFTGPDPTNGNVNYIDMETAAIQNLLGYIVDDSTNSSRAYIGVDYTNIAANRDSVRLMSKQTFEVGMLAVFDIYHIPTAIGTWPTWWFLGDVSPDGVWPGNGGEADVIEFVHGTPYNSMTLHTAPGCSVNNASTSFQGTLSDTNCNAGEGSEGCSIAATHQDTMTNTTTNARQVLATAGQPFNEQGGAVYAMSWTTSGVSIYIFPRDQLPSDLAAGTPDPSSWTNVKPLAQFSGPGCDFTKSLSTLQLIEDITFCGDWAGKVWSSSGLDTKTGYATCAEYVMMNPESFKEAYFEVGSVRIYSSGGQKPGIASSAKRDLGAVERKVEFSRIDVRDRFADVRNSHQRHGHGHLEVRCASAHGRKNRRDELLQSSTVAAPRSTQVISNVTNEGWSKDQARVILLLHPVMSSAAKLITPSISLCRDVSACGKTAVWIVAAIVMAILAILV